MPHIWVEYSANIEREIDIPRLLKAVQNALIDDGTIFPFAGARTRGIRIDNYHIVDGHPDNAFVYILMRVAPGRKPEDRKEAGDRVLAAARECLADVMTRRPFGLTVQMQESDNTVNLKTSNFREILQSRSKA